MLFSFFRPDDALVRELRVAIACHRPTVLHQLLASHGSRAFANALADLSGRVIAEALPMLVAAEALQVLKHLPHAARRRLHEAQDAGYRDAFGGALALPASPLVRVR
ncbi:hypothetical protein [Curvibacter lanceolatus]|uniref:hypothetical protein n=1 Tax=Curvibacter lanceolatus TaxID=86182 RepID=UPI0003676039|nr:hypothetical protein [Curvibacter lanceolatus]